jgi:hypothetical protein
MTKRCELVIYHHKIRDLQPFLVQIKARSVNICSVKRKGCLAILIVCFSSRVTGYALDAANGVKEISKGTLAL